MISGVLIVSFVIIFFVIAITVVVTIKAYSVTNKETIDPLPKETEPRKKDDLHEA